MDNTQRRVVDFMLEKSYSEAVHRTISGFILKSLSEIQGTLKLDEKFVMEEMSKYAEALQPQVLRYMKDRAFEELLKTDKVKQELMFVMRETHRKRLDILQEIMKQFGLEADDQHVYIHDKLGTIFDKYYSKMMIAIGRADYGYMCEAWKE
jgi:16S rRNA C1402 (ribose-2'-O) methylase RsmI